MLEDLNLVSVKLLLERGLNQLNLRWNHFSVRKYLLDFFDDLSDFDLHYTLLLLKLGGLQVRLKSDAQLCGSFIFNYLADIAELGLELLLVNKVIRHGRKLLNSLL